ncbi:MAG: winged helix-turn-helix transcriptional regulator [Clostridia bacterium]|nr:winged helix-turn-helix transcriptional regulator [Clostridia bacterium]
MEEKEVALICKALGDPNRLRIINMLSEEEMCACKLLEKFEITQPTLSHHMKILCDCGLVKSRREGKWSYYSLHCDTFQSFQEYIGRLSCCADPSEC